MKKIFVVFPHQLFKSPDIIPKRTKDQIYLVEHPLYFSVFPYHKLKLILHRATMKMYFDYLKDLHEASNVMYIDCKDYKSFFDKLKREGTEIAMYDPVDHSIYAEYREFGIKFKDSPMFFCTNQDIKDYYANSNKKFHQTDFYKWQRTRLKLMVDEKGKPWGKQWTFDEENRKPFPKDFSIDVEIQKNESPYVAEATEYVEKHFSLNIGSTHFYLPINYKEAEEFLEDFLLHRFKLFGPYQDAVDPSILIGAHSLLSPLINIGLLTPSHVIHRAIDFYSANTNKIPIQSLEGFVRQVVGWREYVRMVYILEPVKLSEVNHYNHTRKISKAWYTGETGMPPIDSIIKKFIKIGYSHHIERLMYLGNLMYLMRMDPKEVYSYFMMFIDAYPWVMEANVFGMSQQSSGQLMMRKPYFSSSNYIVKMSSFGKKKDSGYKKVCKKDWWEVWDALYYSFIHDNRKELKTNYATARQVIHLDNKSEKEVKELLRLAEEYMNSY